MATPGVDDLYYGTEVWDVQNSVNQFIAAFGDTTTRAAVLAQGAYSGKPEISVFLSEQTIKDLTQVTGNNTLRQGVKGVVLLMGFDQTNLTIIARSADGKATRPAGAAFTNFNYKPANSHILDTDANTLMAAFATANGGYAKLSGWAANQHPTFTFDCDILLALLYSNNPTTGGQITMHIVIAPPWSNDNSANYISIVAQKGTTYRAAPPCPPYCYQNV